MNKKAVESVGQQGAEQHGGDALRTYRAMSGPRAHRRGCDCGGIEPATGLSCGQLEELIARAIAAGRTECRVVVPAGGADEELEKRIACVKHWRHTEFHAAVDLIYDLAAALRRRRAP